MYLLCFIVVFIVVFIVTSSLLKVSKIADQNAGYDEESFHNSNMSDVEDN